MVKILLKRIEAAGGVTAAAKAKAGAAADKAKAAIGL